MYLLCYCRRYIFILLLCAIVVPCSALNRDWFIVKRAFRFFQEALLQRSLDQAQPNYGITFQCRSESNPRAGPESNFYLQLGKLEGFQLLKPNKRLMLFLHGWQHRGTQEWQHELLKTWTYFATDYNVCVVDWSHLSVNDYKSASRSIFDVGLTVATIIEYLEIIQPQLTRQNSTIIGFSLGAHAAGYAGQRLNGQLQQIIGLDAAAPLFTTPAKVSSRYRLDKSDARYVQVLHTSGGTLGTDVKSGHADFYPNGGKAPQPNCPHFIRWHDININDPLSCSHSTASAFFEQSLNPFYPFVGFHCDSYKNFTDGRCNQNRRARFGVHSHTQNRGNFYFITQPRAPYVPSIVPTSRLVTFFIN